MVNDDFCESLFCIVWNCVYFFYIFYYFFLRIKNIVVILVEYEYENND